METKKEKVFIIGFHKTSTTTMEKYLESLGYRVFGGDKNLMKFDSKEERQKYIQHLLSNYDAAQDMPWPLFYEELYEMYPTAKFILTIRDEQKWISSVVRYFASIRVPLHRKIYDVPCAEGYEDVYLKKYRSHNETVKQFFHDKDNFMILDLAKESSTERFLKFIDRPTERLIAFPRYRSNNKVLYRFKLGRLLRSFCWNIIKGY